METPRLLSLREVAAMTRLTEGTLRWYRHRGLGPAGFRLGRRVVYREADVVAWIEQHRSAQLGPER
ncbi:MAG: helix-turn-helix transcriptional regulator [Mycobacterium leprae]